MAQRRFNPLTREWVLVSPHRADRPWLGERSQPATATALQYGPACYLCPGNERAGGARNPHYTSQYVFVNDYPALTRDIGDAGDRGDAMLISRAVEGEC